MDFSFVTVASITVICYLVAEFVKVTKLDTKFIPIIVGVIGAILGVVGFYIGIPDFPAEDIFSSIAIGIVSGLASTGVNQIGKQLSADKEVG